MQSDGKIAPFVVRNDTGWRGRFERVLIRSALIFLISSVIRILTVLLDARDLGLLPEGPWGVWEGNHGPWHRIFLLPEHPLTELSRRLDTAFILLVLSVVTSFSSLLLRFNRNKIYLFSCCLFALYLAIDQLYWLID